MFVTFNSNKPINTKFKKDYIKPEFKNVSNPNNQNKERLKKAVIGLTCLAALGVAAVGINNLKNTIQLKHIDALNIEGLKTANNSVREMGSRGKEAVDTYRKLIAKKKYDVLQYKISHGLLKGKSENATIQIFQNIRKLEELASRA